MKGIIMFAVGAALGSLATWRFLKNRYEEYVKEEIQSVKEAYGRQTPEKEEEPIAATESEEVKEEANTMIHELKYSSKEGGSTGHPYVITPEEFASTKEYYDKITLTLYASGEVEDDDGVTLYTPEEVDNMIGTRNLDCMGEYEKGVVYVRNDILQSDFEVVADDSDYLSVRSNL